MKTLGLVLQLRLSAIMGFGGMGLVNAPPERPTEHERAHDGRREHDPRQDGFDFGRRGHEAAHPAQARIFTFGLLSFALLEADDRLNSAVSLARNAAAAMTSVM